ncbi:MAG: transcription antitermination factor NusB [Victivallaceae bacterium]|nr:transcription antitermination factor NusB [Victivallaceae bacterium]
MSEYYGFEELDETVGMPSHTKRTGRELAMLYLFGRELNGDVKAHGREEFFADASEILHWPVDDRVFRKGCAYAGDLLDIIALNQDEIDDRIRKHSSNWEWARISLVDRNIMRVAVCEMLHMASVPPVVSINEAVEIALDYSDENSGNFINGVLNAVKDELSRPAREAVDHL